MMDVDDLEDRMDELDRGEVDEDLVIDIYDRNADGNIREHTRCYYDERGEWVSETVVESKSLDPDEHDEWEVS